MPPWLCCLRRRLSLCIQVYICTRRPCVGYWSIVFWEQSSSHVASFACSGSLFQMWMYCKGGHYRGFFLHAHYRSAQTFFLGTWGGGSNKMRCRIGFRRCRIGLFWHKLSPGGAGRSWTTLGGLANHNTLGQITIWAHWKFLREGLHKKQEIIWAFIREGAVR